MRLPFPRPEPSAVHRAVLDLHVTESRLCQVRLREPWAVRVPPDPHQSVLLGVAQGACAVEVEGGDVTLAAGDFLLLPRGDPHTLADRRGTPAIPLGALALDPVHGMCVMQAEGDGAKTRLIVCAMRFRVSPVLSVLPAALPLMRSAETEAVAGGVLAITGRPGPDSDATASMLIRVLATTCIRQWLEGCDVGARAMAALQETAVRQAMDAIHADPRRKWSLASLSREAGVSPSGLSQKFVAAIGVPPMRYWTRWRMSVAHEWLRRDQMSVDEVADALGYASRAAFARTFKSATGANPGATRRSGQTGLVTLTERAGR